jgi:hypothetical protein
MPCLRLRVHANEHKPNRPVARPDCLRLPFSHSLRLIVVLDEKLLEVMGDGVTPDPTRAFADGGPTTC